MAKNARNELSRDAVLRAAHGLCQCTGECGHNHQWQESQPATRCRAPFHQNIRRKKDHPSCWRLGPSDTGPLEYAELYSDKDILVKVKIVQKGNGKDTLALAFCERCAKLAGDLNAVRVMPE